MIRVGLIGLGYWGPNLVRCFTALPDCHVTAVCDQDVDRLAKIRDQFPGVHATPDNNEILNRNLVDAVVIATPTKTHYRLARQALESGIHTFVEKPLATSSAECEELIELSHTNDLILFVGHVFLYSAAIGKLKQLVDSGDLGDLCYISSSRLNLGPVRHDVNALWDLAPHDISVMLHLMDAPPDSVSCSGLAYLNGEVHDVCSLSLNFEDKRYGIVHVSWLDPYKKREMTVVGNKKMAVYNDIEPLEKIKVYDIGIDAPDYANSFGEFPYSYRYGDTYSPRLNEVEPLRAECHAFMESVLTGCVPKTDGYNGLEVVRVIEAAQCSLENGQGRVNISRTQAATKDVLA